jgi:hypothetical protein
MPNIALDSSVMYSGGSAGPPPFDPTQISGCVLWLRADRGITLNGSTVSAWADQSGNAHDFLQATASKQPGFSASGGPNGTPYLFTTGAGGIIQMDCPSWGNLSTPFDDFAVCNCVAGSGSNNEYILDFGAGLTDDIILEVSSTHITLGFGSAVFQSTSFGVDFICETIPNGAASKLSLNNAAPTVGSAATAATGTNMTIFNYVGGFNSWNGRMYEVVVYNRVISNTERTTLTRYLGTRYNISVP